MVTKHGLIIFERERIGLRPSRGTAPAGRLTHCNWHHGGPEGAPRMTYAAAAATWRSWQSYHMGKGWNDIGYTFGLDGRGRLYEGRPVGALTASVEGCNSNGVAIVAIQDGRYYELTPAARATMRVLFEHGIPELKLPPLKTLRNRGHNEYPGHASNECPGAKIAQHLRWRRERY